jgi:protein-tyrosine phosphatase
MSSTSSWSVLRVIIFVVFNEMWKPPFSITFYLHKENFNIRTFAPMRVLMVCLGNICRSPLAEGILRQQADKAGLEMVVDSAGTAAYHIGEAPHVLSQKVARMNGIDIGAHKGRQFRKEDMDRYDHIYVMDSENYNDVRRAAGNKWDPAKVDLLLNELYPGENRGVPDPWYGEEDAYHAVFGMIEKASRNIIHKAQQK